MAGPFPNIHFQDAIREELPIERVGNAYVAIRTTITKEVAQDGGLVVDETTQRLRVFWESYKESFALACIEAWIESGHGRYCNPQPKEATNGSE